MSNRKSVIFFITCSMICWAAVQSEKKDLCQRPLSSFENLKHVNEYIDCIKSQIGTRYGKRSFPPALLGKIRPDFYTDYNQPSENWKELYDILKFVDN